MTTIADDGWICLLSRDQGGYSLYGGSLALTDLSTKLLVVQQVKNTPEVLLTSLIVIISLSKNVDILFGLYPLFMNPKLPPYRLNLLTTDLPVPQKCDSK